MFSAPSYLTNGNNFEILKDVKNCPQQPFGAAADRTEEIEVIIPKKLTLIVRG